MQDQRWYVDFFQVPGHIRFREGLDTEITGRHASHHALQPERLAHALRNLGPWSVVAIERHAEVLPELRAIGKHASPELVKDFDRQAAGISCAFEHNRWYRTDEDS